MCARPAQGYKVDGKRVPGVTTIVGRFKDAGALIHWAWQCGVDGKDYKKERDSAASAGNLAHDMIHNWTLGLPPFPELEREHTVEQIQQAKGAFRNFKQWAQTVDMTVIRAEEPLTSVAHRYGGTPDAVVKCAEGPMLLDYKTGKDTRIFVETWLQLGGYSVLLRECLDIDCQGAHVVKLSREGAGFKHKTIDREQLREAETIFLAMRLLYTKLQKVGKW